MTIQDNVRAILETNFPCVKDDLLDNAVKSICNLRPFQDTPKGKQVIFEGEKYVILEENRIAYMVFRSCAGNLIIKDVAKMDCEFTGKTYPGIGDFLIMIQRFFEEEDHGND